MTAVKEETFVDPVCGMTITKDSAAGSTNYQGQTYYFCSPSCQLKFLNDPEKYVGTGADAAPKTHMHHMHM
ncbi:MAG: YHS domain-containing protein [Actinomycetaceae bacterium]|nr:YHS domain-containing protein [Actinomycetaceae bacterium]MDY6082861.1 YHS domain-containing protein [Actinomycetaceae bacterium]